MTRRNAVEAMLERYGTDVLIVGSGRESEQTRALIQPLNYRTKLYPDIRALAAGYFDESHYLYIGPAKNRVDQLQDAVLQAEDNRFLVLRAQTWKVGNEIIYVWAILKPLEDAYVETTAGPPAGDVAGR